MKAATNWQQLSEEASKDRRRERRIHLAFPIEVSGFDVNGRYFVERTATSDVSQSGCQFPLQTEVGLGTFVAIKLVSRESGTAQPGRPLLYQVVRVAQEEKGWTLGASNLQKENLWCVAFPTEKRLSPVA